MNRTQQANDLATLFNNPARLFGNGNAPSPFAPTLDVYETNDHLVITMEVPGLGAEDLDIHFEDRVLTISGEKKALERDEGTHTHRMERRYGRFSRSITVPQAYNDENIEATVKHGVLTVSLAKRPESKPRKIQIKPE